MGEVGRDGAFCKDKDEECCDCGRIGIGLPSKPTGVPSFLFHPIPSRYRGTI